MRAHLALIACTLTLTSCGPRTTYLSANQCWSLYNSDKVKGTAILSTEEAHDCVECGARVSGPDCPSYSLTTDQDSVSRNFRRIMKSSPHDRFGGIQQTVYLSGDVIHNARTGESIIIARELRPVDSSGN